MMELIILVFLLLFVNYILVFEEMSWKIGFVFFESGFENQLWSKLSPSLHFFKIGLIFILFDLEFLFLLMVYFWSSWVWAIALIVFMMVTLWFELVVGSLDWSF